MTARGVVSRTRLEIALVDAQTVTLLCDCRKGRYCPCASKALYILAEAISRELTSRRDAPSRGKSAPDVVGSASSTPTGGT